MYLSLTTAFNSRRMSSGQTNIDLHTNVDCHQTAYHYLQHSNEM